MLSIEPRTGTKRDFLSILDFTPEDLENCLALAATLKSDRRLDRLAAHTGALRGLHVAMLFEKPSLRTRTTFEIAVKELGGNVVGLPPEVALGGRETPADVARALERWVDAVVIRTFAHQRLVEFASAAARLHVINALSDEQHPCQALADLQTLHERWGRWQGHTIAFVGDGNNVARSLGHAAAMLGINIHFAAPRGYELAAPVVEEMRRVSRSGARIRLFDDPVRAVRGADAVYTDVWTSMGQESETAIRRGCFAGFQVTSDLMAKASPGALFMHCLPAHRGEEVTADVLESAGSIVFDQAENRLHTHKALLLMLMTGLSGVSSHV